MGILSSPRIEVANDYEAIFSDMYGRGFTDGLPVVPPTEKAVNAMLSYAGLAPDEFVAVLAPDNSRVSAEKLAVNAVMAGCLPQYFPVVVAAVKAMAAPKYNLLSVQATTNPVGPVVVVNGPIRNEIGVNCGRGCMGPGRRANATIGRTLRLIMVNCGGATVGEIDKSIHGMPGKYTFCFGELEEQSPWPGLHVDQGFSPEQSTVSLFAATGTQNIMAFFRTPENLVHVMSDAIRAYGSNGYIRMKGNPLVVLTPGHARIFADHGWDKKRIGHELFAACLIPRSYIPSEVQTLTPDYADFPPDQMCSPCEKADDIVIVVAGGPEAYHTCYLPSFAPTAISTVEVVAPTIRRAA